MARYGLLRALLLCFGGLREHSVLRRGSCLGERMRRCIRRRRSSVVIHRRRSRWHPTNETAHRVLHLRRECDCMRARCARGRRGTRGKRSIVHKVELRGNGVVWRRHRPRPLHRRERDQLGRRIVPDRRGRAHRHA